MEIQNESKLKEGYNPRKNFDIADLKESIKKHGLLVPLLVRPLDKGFA